MSALTKLNTEKFQRKFRLGIQADLEPEFTQIWLSGSSGRVVYVTVSAEKTKFGKV